MPPILSVSLMKLCSSESFPYINIKSSVGLSEHLLYCTCAGYNWADIKGVSTDTVHHSKNGLNQIFKIAVCSSLINL